MNVSPFPLFLFPSFSFSPSFSLSFACFSGSKFCFNFSFLLSNLFFLQLFLLHVFRNLLFPSHDNEPFLLLLARVNFSLTTSNRFSLILKLFFFSRSLFFFFCEHFISFYFLKSSFFQSSSVHLTNCTTRIEKE